MCFGAEFVKKGSEVVGEDNLVSVADPATAHRKVVSGGGMPWRSLVDGTVWGSFG
jgi:hypothetical protein